MESNKKKMKETTHYYCGFCYIKREDGTARTAYDGKEFKTEEDLIKHYNEILPYFPG